jgi:hypothetical protein
VPFGPGAFLVKFLLSPLSKSGASLLNSPVRLEKFARNVGWLKRKARKLSPKKFVSGILLAVSQGEASFRLLASSIGLHSDHTISKQALWERVGPEAVELFKGVLASLLASVGINASSLPAIPCVRRILVQDSTLIPLHEKLAALFPATSNQHGHVGAGVRLQSVIDLISGQPLEMSLHPYLRTDQKAAHDVLAFVQAGDLLIRDLGYLVADALQEIARRGAYFLSRHLGKRVLHHTSEHGGAQIDLLSYLRQHAPNQGDTVDVDVVVGSGQHGAARLECRLAARRLPQAAADARLRKAHQDEKRRGKQLSKTHLELLAWETYLTNLPRAEADSAKVAAIYRLRWRIEIVFKALKGYTPGLKVAKHHSNANHVQVLVLAWLCLVVLAMRTGGFALAAGTGTGGALAPRCLSLLKVISKIFQFLGLALLAACASDPHTLAERWFRQTEYHDRYERRRKRKNMAELLGETLGLT